MEGSEVLYVLSINDENCSKVDHKTNTSSRTVQYGTGTGFFVLSVLAAEPARFTTVASFRRVK